MRYLYALMGIFLLLVATAAAGSFKAEMDVDTYVDADNANQSFADSDPLWAASHDKETKSLVYLSFINLFGSQGIFNPDEIASATLTLDAAQVDEPGKVKAYFLNGASFETMTWYDKMDYDAKVYSSPVDIIETGSYILDVTPIIKKAIETCAEGCGYSIVIVAEDDASVGFRSSEGSGNKPTLEYVTKE